MPQNPSSNSLVFELSEPLARKLRTVLEEDSWELREAPYCRFTAKKNRTSVAAYTSGKLVVQGAGAAEFVEFVLEPRVLGELAFQRREGVAAAPPPPFTAHAGIDESGKGDFFGPLVVACAYVPDEAAARTLEQAGVRDSKLIRDPEIARLAGLIRQTLPERTALVVMGPAAYNRLYDSFGNLNRLLAWGHARALEDLLARAPDCPRAISDQFGNAALVRNALMKAGRSIRLEQHPKAEADVAVAAASILARAEFVRRLRKLGEEHGLTLPKGGGAAVDAAAARLAVTGGEALLRQVAKAHFRNYCRALGLPEPERKAYRGFRVSPGEESGESIG